jgi:hypothetical protein
VDVDVYDRLQKFASLEVVACIALVNQLKRTYSKFKG